MRLSKICKWGMAGAQEGASKKFKQFVQNDNLQFEDTTTKMTLYPFIPSLKTKDGLFYTISEDFNSKLASPDTKGISFSLKYSQLATLLSVPAKSGQAAWIHSERLEGGKKRWKTLQIRDNSQQKNLQFNLTEGEGKVTVAEELQGKGGEVKAHFKLEYPHQRLWRALIEGSLFELSGQKLMYEIRAMQEIQLIAHSEITKSREIANETKQFFNN